MFLVSVERPAVFWRSLAERVSLFFLAAANCCSRLAIKELVSSRALLSAVSCCLVESL